MTDASRIASEGSSEERELAGYLEELISATLAHKAPSRPVEGWGANEPAPVDLVGDDSEQTAAPEMAAEDETPRQKSPPRSRQTERTSRASMSEELAALFRPTEQSPPLSPRTAVPSSPAMARQPGIPATEPSAFLQRFLQQAARPPEPAPSGLADLDARLAGGFGSGLHVVLGRSGVGKTAFLDSVAWEAVTSERPVIYYSLREGSLGAWERLISALGNILGDPTIPLATLRARRLGPHELEELTRLDMALQNSVLPFLSLVETIPASTDTLSAFLEDVRSRAREAEEWHGRIPLLLIDDLERLLLLTGSQPLLHVLSRLDDTLSADSMPGLVAATSPDRSTHGPDRLPAQTTLALVSVATPADDDFDRVDLEVRANSRTGWTGALPLLLDRRSGLFAQLSQ